MDRFVLRHCHSSYHHMAATEIMENALPNSSIQGRFVVRLRSSIDSV